MRLAAEFDNFRKRSAREWKDYRERATSEVLREMIDLARAGGVDAVVAEPQFNPRAARSLAESAEIPLVILDPLGRDDQRFDEFVAAAVEELARALAPEAP